MFDWTTGRAAQPPGPTISEPEPERPEPSTPTLLTDHETAFHDAVADAEAQLQCLASGGSGFRAQTIERALETMRVALMALEGDAYASSQPERQGKLAECKHLRAIHEGLTRRWFLATQDHPSMMNSSSKQRAESSVARLDRTVTLLGEGADLLEQSEVIGAKALVMLERQREQIARADKNVRSELAGELRSSDKVRSLKAVSVRC